MIEESIELFHNTRFFYATLGYQRGYNAGGQLSDRFTAAIRIWQKFVDCIAFWRRVESL